MDSPFYSNVPISRPVVVPEAEEYQMNGFAWNSDIGLMVSYRQTGDTLVDVLYRLRQNERLTGNEGQDKYGK